MGQPFQRTPQALTLEIWESLSRDAQLALQFSFRVQEADYLAKEGDILGWGAMVFPEKFSLPFCKALHGYLVETADEELTGTKAPRGYAKTLIRCFLIPIFKACYEPERYRHYLNVQATETKALSVNTSIKEEFETNPVLYKLFGNQIGRRWTDKQFVTKKGVCFTAIGAGTSVRGINYRNTRPDFFVIDDLYDEDHIHNPDATVGRNNWVWSSLYPARAKGRKSCFHVQGTAINQFDILHNLETDPRAKCRTFKAVIDDDTQEVLWPELDTYESLQAQKVSMGTLIFLRELQNEPTDDAVARVKRYWLYKADGTSWEYEPQDLYYRLNQPGSDITLLGIILGFDPSVGKRKGVPAAKVLDDPSGWCLCLMTQQVNQEGVEFWFEDVGDEMLSMQERINKLKDIRSARPALFPITDVRIEAISGFDDFATITIRDTNLPVSRVEWVPDKLTNLENRAHYFENGKAHLNKNLPKEIKEKLVHQLTTNYPQHDDIRDACLLTMEVAPDSWASFMGVQ